MNLTYGDIQRVAVAMAEYAVFLQQEAARLRGVAKEYENTSADALPNVLQMRGVNYARIAALFESASKVELTRGGDAVPVEPALLPSAGAHLIAVVKFKECDNCPCNNLCRMYAKCGQET